VVAFVTSIIALALGIGLVFWVGDRRPVGTPLTWAEAMLGSVFVLALLLLGYAILPNQWLQWADNELKWRADAIAYKLSFFDRGTITITKQAIRDIVATVIYVVLLGLNVFLWSKWQKRGQKVETPAIETSTYGRPLVRKA
jgi:hypothetical protein